MASRGELRSYAGDEAPEAFIGWLDKVDAVVMRRVGLSLFDLPDFLPRDEWEAGTSPSRAAREVISAAGFSGE